MKSFRLLRCCRQQSIKYTDGRVCYKYFWFLGLVVICTISHAQERADKAGHKQYHVSQNLTVKVMRKNGKSWLAGPGGMTLYTLVESKAGLNRCIESCAKNWPPFVVDTTHLVAPSELKGRLGTIRRLMPDYRIQVTYQGQPLYYWFGDKNPGDKTGDGVGGIWFAVKP